MGLKKNTVSKRRFIIIKNGLYNLIYTSHLYFICESFYFFSGRVFKFTLNEGAL